MYYICFYCYKPPSHGQGLRCKNWPWPRPFKVKMTPNGQNNIKIEFHTPELVEIEVLQVYILSKANKIDFHHGRRQPYLILPLEATFLIWGLDTQTKFVLHTLTLKLLLKTKLLHQFEMKSRNCLCTPPPHYEYWLRFDTLGKNSVW